jgi:hypothetical protein
MKRFEKLTTSEILVNIDRTKKVEIQKFQKIGTKRVFFVPLIDGNKRMTTTLFAYKCEAVKLAKQYLNN